VTDFHEFRYRNSFTNRDSRTSVTVTDHVIQQTNFYQHFPFFLAVTWRIWNAKLASFVKIAATKTLLETLLTLYEIFVRFGENLPQETSIKWTERLRASWRLAQLQVTLCWRPKTNSWPSSVDFYYPTKTLLYRSCMLLLFDTATCSTDGWSEESKHVAISNNSNIQDLHRSVFVGW